MKNITIKRNVSLREMTTFKIGGRARYFTELKDKKELIEAVDFSKKNKLDIFVLGGGSDVLISDTDINKLVIKYVAKTIKFKEEFKEEKDAVLVTVEAGVIWDDLVKKIVEKELQGIECMSGIPGTVGASPIQNIGAYGQELKDVFYELEAYDIEKNDFVKFNKKACRFAYRESTFKQSKYKGRYIITNITLRLYKDKPSNVKYESLKNYLKENKIKSPSLKDIRKAVLSLRSKRLDDPCKIANAGSFFKNPFVDTRLFHKLKEDYPNIPFHKVNSKYKLFAGWLIESTGWKGKSFKNARVSNKNALVITNPENKAFSKEIQELATKISKDVYKKFQVRIEPEVQFIK